MTTVTDRRMPRGHAISVIFLAVWWAKLEKNNKVRHNVTQIASLLLELKMEGGGLNRYNSIVIYIANQGNSHCFEILFQVTLLFQLLLVTRVNVYHSPSYRLLP